MAKEEPESVQRSLEDVLSFLDREPAEPSATVRIEGVHGVELAKQLVRQLGAAFPTIGLSISNPPVIRPFKGGKDNDGKSLGDALTDVFPSVHVTHLEADASVEIHVVESSSGSSFDRALEGLLGPERYVQSSPRREHVDYLLLAVPMQSRGEGLELEQSVRSRLDKSLGGASYRIIRPEVAWAILFGEYNPRPDVARIYMLSDDAIDSAKYDQLGFMEYASAFGGLINDPNTRTPLTLAINAKWGVGKTSLAHMIDEHLKQGSSDQSTRPPLTYWFNAWMHDEADDLAKAFMTDIVRFASNERPLWRRVLQPLPSELCSQDVYRRRRLWLVLGAIAASSIASFVLLSEFGAQIFEILDVPGFVDDAGALQNLNLGRGGLGVVIAVLAFALLRYVGDAVGTLATFTSMQQHPADTGSVNQVRRRLKHLVLSATGGDRKLVVFIDDLERCRPTRSIDVLEVVNQLLSFEGVVCIVVADMAALAANAEIKYAKLAERYNPEAGEEAPDTASTRNAYGRLFLQKFIQLSFDLPEPSKAKIREMVEKTSPEAEDGAAAGTERPSQVRAFLRERKPGGVVELVSLGLFAPWNSDEVYGDRVRRLLGSAPLLMYLIWLPLLPFYWASGFALRALGLVRLSPSNGSVARIARAYLLALALIAQGLMGLAVLFFGSELKLAAGVQVAPLRGEAALISADLVENLQFASQLVLLASMLVVTTGLVVLALGFYQRRRDARQVSLAVAAAEKEGEAGDGGWKLERPEDSPLSDHAWRALMLRKRQQFLSQDSELFETARDYAFEHVLPIPRNAKRLMNRLRLHLFILDQKGAFSRDSEFSPQHLGKWVALNERWPELATTIVHDPAKMSLIENSLSTAGKDEDTGARNELSGILRELGFNKFDDPDLHDLLAVDPPLNPVIGQLTRFEVSEGDASN